MDRTKKNGNWPEGHCEAKPSGEGGVVNLHAHTDKAGAVLGELCVEGYVAMTGETMLRTAGG